VCDRVCVCCVCVTVRVCVCVCVCVCVSVLQELHGGKLGQGAGGCEADAVPGITSELPDEDGEQFVDGH